MLVDLLIYILVTIQPSDTLRNAAVKMLGRTHGCLPVMDQGMDQGKVAGIITTTDLRRAVSQA